MKIAEGNVGSSPFARTIFSLAAKRFTGDLILTKSRREYRSSWEGGSLVAATSPSPADSPGRVALAQGLVNSTALGIIVQKLGDEPGRDPIDVIAEIASLSPEQRVTLKYRVLARTAARMFALPDADFVVDNARTMRADAQLPKLDIRWLIYFGLRTHYSLSRLTHELQALGERGMSLPAEVLPRLPAFGFAGEEEPVLDLLQKRELSLANLVVSCPTVDQATTTCVVYSLMACGYLSYGEAQAPPAPKPAAQPQPPRSRPEPRSPRKASGVTVQGAGLNPAAPAKVAEGTVQSTDFVDPNKYTPQAAATAATIVERLALLNSDCSHYALLGVPERASDDQVRKGYFALARQLHPDRLRAVGVINLESESQELFAAINKAFAVLSNPKERAQYLKILAAGGEKAYAREQKLAEDMATAILRAEEHYHLGEMALRRDSFAKAANEFRQAMELSPDESEYQALYAWAFLCNAPNRELAASEAMKLMSAAVLKGPKSVTTALYLSLIHI